MLFILLDRFILIFPIINMEATSLALVLRHCLLCCYSVAKSCPTLCDPMDCSTPGLPVLCSNSCALSQCCHSTILSSVGPFSSCPSFFPELGSFPMSQPCASGGWSIGASALASVLPMNIQGWFPLGLTGLMSLLSKGLSRVFSSTTVRKHQSFGAHSFI